MKRKRLWKLLNINKNRVKQVYSESKEIINQHLWLELLTMVALALFTAGIVFFIVSKFIYSLGFGKEVLITYDDSRAYIQEVMLNRIAWINDVASSDMDEEQINSQIQEIITGEFDRQYVSNSQTYLVDSTGKIRYQNGVIESLNLAKVIQKANTNAHASEYSDEYGSFVAIYPVIVHDEVCYLYNESVLQPFSEKEFTNIGNVLALAAATATFILIIFRLTRDKIAYIEYLSVCLGEISKGNLEYDIEVVGQDELARVAQSIRHMEDELKYQIDAQIKTEKSKNELVTNVAHDLRTPLTSIIGYIGLVKANDYSHKDTKKYLEIAYNKAESLKMIIEDLFELTKLHQGNVAIKKSEVSLFNLLNQLVEELMPIANEKGIEIESYIDSKETTINIDIAKMTRVFENLIENAIKYSPENETIYIEMKSTRDKLYIAVSNPSEKVSQEEINKYFERFYRADSSRNSTGGSGLGLAIAKNIVELHGGTIEAKFNVDLISFLIILPK